MNQIIRMMNKIRDSYSGSPIIYHLFAASGIALTAVPLAYVNPKVSAGLCIAASITGLSGAWHAIRQERRQDHNTNVIE